MTGAKKHMKTKNFKRQNSFHIFSLKVSKRSNKYKLKYLHLYILAKKIFLSKAITETRQTR